MKNTFRSGAAGQMEEMDYNTFKELSEWIKLIMNENVDFVTLLIRISIVILEDFKSNLVSLQGQKVIKDTQKSIQSRKLFLDRLKTSNSISMF